MTKAPSAFEIEVFRPGTFTPMKGPALTFSAEDLTDIAGAYDPDGSPAPAVVGHPQTDAPAFGWASSFSYDGERQRLIATVDDLEPAFAEAVRDRRYRKVSMAFHKPDAPNNPKPGAYYPKHIGFLGAAAPAVSGLKPVELAGTEDESVIIEFGEAGFRDTASILRRVRDFFIEQFGLEQADSVLPSYEIDWLERRADDDPKPSFAEPAPEPTVPPKPQEIALPDPKKPDARETEFAVREARIAAREAAHRHAENAAFADGLVSEGRLLPVVKNKVVVLLDALAGSETAEVSFAGDDGKPRQADAAETLKELLKAAPVAVTFGAAALGAGPGTTDTAFSAPDARRVDGDGLELHAKAVAYQRDHPDVTFIQAVKAVS